MLHAERERERARSTADKASDEAAFAVEAVIAVEALEAKQLLDENGDSFVHFIR